MTPRLSPSAAATVQSIRVRPRTRGRASAATTTALVASRSHTIVVGSTWSKRLFAIAAPNCTERMPVSTSHTGDRAGRSGTRTRYKASRS